jgi:hypothetical protein
MIGQQQRRERPWADTAQLDHAESVERAGHQKLAPLMRA